MNKQINVVSLELIVRRPSFLRDSGFCIFSDDMKVDLHE